MNLIIEPENTLDFHFKNYKMNAMKVQKEMNNMNKIIDIVSFFLSNKCKVTKYSHSIDRSSQAIS